MTQVIGRHVTDKGHREFITFVFARLQNSRCLEEGVDIFHHLCTILLAKRNTATVQDSVQALEKVICLFKCEPIDIPEGAIQQSKTIAASSPFSAVFRRVCEDSTAVINAEEESPEDNRCYCPGVVTALLDNCMSVFPMWIGLMWVNDNLLLTSTRKKTRGNKEALIKTKQETPTVMWKDVLGIVKHILNKKKQMRPGTFLRTMYTSLHGRDIASSLSL